MYLAVLESPLQDHLRRIPIELLSDRLHHCVVQHKVLHVSLLEPLRAQRAVPLHARRGTEIVVLASSMTSLIPQWPAMK